MRSYPLFRMANVVYKYAFWLYYPVYVLYKNISDRNEMSFVRRSVKPGNRVVDIGANIGIYTKRLAKLTGPGGEVYAFEPHPRNFALLLKLTRGLLMIRAYPAAISDQTGTIQLYVSTDLNVDHRTYQTAEKRTKQQVACYSLDSFLQEKPVDFIKMDIQGSEYNALLGMQKTMCNNPRLTMLMELWPYGLSEAGSSCKAVIDLLRESRFFLYLVKRGGLVEFSEHLIGCNEHDYYSLYATKQPFEHL